MTRPTFTQEPVFGVDPSSVSFKSRMLEWGVRSVYAVNAKTEARRRNSERKQTWRNELKAQGLWNKGVKRNAL